MMQRTNRLVSTAVVGFIVLFMVGLSGCAGPQGPMGPQGPRGPQGPAGSPGLAAQPSLSAAATPSNTAQEALARVEPTLVRIDTTGLGFQGSGSGTLVDNRGYVVTNYHVIDQARTIKVTVMDVDVFDGSVVAGDATRDLALVQIRTSRSDLPAVVLGQAADMSVGADVLVGGFPLGAGLAGPATFTKGIVSAVRVLSDGQKYIQTDAAINPGNSGGCLFTLEGKMIGVPSAGIEPPGEDIEGIGLAVPIDDVLTFIEENLP